MSVFNGTAARDEFEGTIDTDIIRGEGGNDYLEDNLGGDDQIFGGDGTDFVIVRRDSDARSFSTVLLDGGDGDDYVYATWRSGFGMDATLRGGAGDDRFSISYNQYAFVSSNRLSINAGSGDDLIYLTHNSAVTLRLGSGQDQVEFNSSSGTSAHSGDIELVTINDFEGGSLGDRLQLEPFLVRMTDWDGISNPFSAGYLQLLQSGTDVFLQLDVTGTGSVWTDFIRFRNISVGDLDFSNLGFSIVIEGSNGADDLVGGVGDNLIYGRRGNDLLSGGEGDDSLYGGAQNDTLHGGDGDDRLYGQNGENILYGDAGNDRLFGGNTGTDIISGGTGNDILKGGRGDDFLNGDEGDDVIYGQAGADILDGGSGNDRLYGQGGESTLNGGDGNDALYGGALSDVLDGGAGNDLLRGEGGDDILTGGSGSDKFQMRQGAGNDVITDFESGIDTLIFKGVSGVSSEANLTVVQTADGVEITYGANAYTVLLIGLDVSDLTSGDFAFA